MRWIENKNAASDTFDKVLKETKYKVHADIGFLSGFFREEKEGVIWNISNSAYIDESKTCYFNILFNVKIKSDGKIDFDNFEFANITLEHCDQ